LLVLTGNFCFLDPGIKPERTMTESRLILHYRKFDVMARSGTTASIRSSFADASAGVVTARDILRWLGFS
jgi:hypothetical protein